MSSNLMENSNYQTQEFVAHQSQVNCLSFGTQSNQIFATGGEDRCVNLWQVGSIDNILTISGQNKAPVESLCFDSDDRNVIAGCFNGSIKVFDLSSGKTARQFSTNCSVSSLHYHPHGELFASGSVDHTMKVWDARHKNCIQTYNGHSKEITCVRFSPDGKWVASAAKDGQMLFWDLVAGKLVNSFKVLPAHITSFEFNPMEFSMAIVTSARTVRFWDLESMQCTYSTPAESSQVRAIAFSNMGTNLFSCSRDTLKVWDIDSRRLVDSFDMQWGDRIADVRVSDNSQLCAAAFNSNFVSVYSADLGESLSAAENGEVEPEAEPVPVRREAKSEKVKRTVAASSVVAERPHSTSEKAVPPTSSRSSRLNGVNQQLSQISSNLRGMHIAEEKESIASNKPSVTAGPRASERYSTPAGGPVEEQEEVPLYDDDFLDEDDSFTSADAKDDNKYDHNHSEKHSSKGEKEVEPGVVWDGADSQDMATSMGESFWRRFQESQREASSNVGEDSDSVIAAAEGPRGSAALEDFLPPSSFSSHSQAPLQQGIRSIQSIQSQQQPPVAVNKAPTPTFARNKIASPVASGGNGRPLSNNQVGRIGQNNVEVSLVDDVVSAPLSVVGQKHANRLNSGGNGGNAVGRGASADASRLNSGGPGKSSHYAESKRIEDLLVSLAADSESFHSELSTRHMAVKGLRSGWCAGNVMRTIEDLRILSVALSFTPSNMHILADFFSAVDFKTTPLSLDACVKVLPVLATMVQASSQERVISEHVVYAIYRSATSLAEAFGELIRSTRSNITIGGVDLSREERLRKCNECHASFAKLRSQVEVFRQRLRAKQRVVEVLREFSSIAHTYFSQ